jgi:F-type H+-transporting ATPase subunit b
LNSLYRKALNWLTYLIVLAAVIAGLAAAPARASQVENPNAPVKSELKEHGQGALPAQPKVAKQGGIKAEESDEETVYTHTPLVASISDAIFHDNPSAAAPDRVALRQKHIAFTARSFEWINTIIILLAIVLPMARILPKVLRKRDQTLKHQLELARKTTAEAQARMSAVEAQLARLGEDIAGMRAHVEEEARQDEARIKASIEEESAKIVASAEHEIAAAAAHAQRSLKAFAADLAIEQAARQLTLTPETDRGLIQEFVASAAGDGAARESKTGGRS